MIATLQSVVGAVLLVVGVALFIVAAVGLLRLPDAFTRLTAVTKAGTLGLVFILFGVLVMEPTVANAIKLILAVVLQLITAPIGGVALSRGSFRSHAPLPKPLQYDQLSEHRDQSS